MYKPDYKFEQYVDIIDGKHSKGLL